MVLPSAGTPGGPYADPIPLADLRPALAAAVSGAALVDRGGGCSGVLVAPATGPIPPGAPAYALTNGHCIDMLDPTVVLRDQGPGGRVDFGWSGAPMSRSVAIRGVPWASMKGTDLAVLELDGSLAELAAAGIRPVPLQAGIRAGPGTPIVIVGGPSPDRGGERILVLTSCSLGARVDLVEDSWWWSGFPLNRCAGIRHGSSGSPVLDARDGTLIGLINTGTLGSGDRADCLFDRPCEVTPEGGVAREDAVYGPALDGLARCFDAGWRFTGPGGDCPLDPGFGVSVTGAVEVTNPDLTPPGRRAPRTTWGATIVPSDASVTHRVHKVGRLGTVDCRDLAGYSAPIAIADAPVVDLPLPREEGHHQLCLLGGGDARGPSVAPDAWQEPRFASVVTAWIDRTPPVAPVRLIVRPTTDGWLAEPALVPPELTTFTWKWGPSATTDCADPGGYLVFRHHEQAFRRAEAPTRICVVGHDPAGNPSPPLERVLE